MAPCKSTCTCQPRGDSFQGCDRSSSFSSPPPLSDERKLATRMRATRQKRFHGSRFSTAPHSPGKRGRWNFRGERCETRTFQRRVSVLIVFSDRFFLPEIPLSQLPSRIWISLIQVIVISFNLILEIFRIEESFKDWKIN